MSPDTPSSVNLEDLLEAARSVVEEWDTETQDGYTITDEMSAALERLSGVLGRTLLVDR